MSEKSILRISLDKPIWKQEDMSRLETLINSKNKKGFSGWTYNDYIGGVYNEPDNYNKLFSALDNASKKFIPIAYKFKHVEFLEDSVSVVYCPDDMMVLSSFREYMEHFGVTFIDSPEDPPVFSMNIEKVQPLTDLQVQEIKAFIPLQTEIVFLTASVLRYTGKNAQLYYQTKPGRVHSMHHYPVTSE